ncbi:MAG TPA: alpha/beta hydrolase [Flavisolibacter sp.]|jgi:pimeloyl-ACP methyl ester carboxylesterase|nr:alpha/beta hydrolase [Flavisolibacter sp.]
MELKELDYQGKNLAYYTKGEGPAIVLLHGFGEDGTIWKNQYDLFPGHQLIIPDLPGTGRSEMIEDMSMEGLADAVKEIITDSSGDSAAVMIGHSMGGYVALAFAEKFPDLLNGFGLFHSTAFADSGEKIETRRKGIDFIQKHSGPEFLKTTIPALYGPATKEERPYLIEEQISSVNNFSGEALVSYYKAMMDRPDRTEVLRNSKVPVLFVMGRHDAAVPLDDVLKQCHLPKVSYIHILEISGHNGMIEEAAESNRILSDFITTIELSTYSG